MPSGDRSNSRPAPRRWTVALLAAGTGSLLLLSATVGFTNAPPAKRKPAPKISPIAGGAAAIQPFLKQNCLACHSKSSASGGLDLADKPFLPADPANFAAWVKLYDRVDAGEMPPKAAPQPTPAARKAFLAALQQPLAAADEARERREGRAVWRRMNRYEYENTLRDLLDAPWLQIRDMLPEDGVAYRFNKVGEALDVSHVQMSRYLAAADFALREVLANQSVRQPTTVRRYYAYDQRSFAGLAKFSQFNGSPERATFPIVADAVDPNALKDNAARIVSSSDPARRDQEAMGVVASAYEPLQPKFTAFRAPISGRYKLRLCAHSFWAGPENERRWWRPSRTDVSAGRTHEPISLYAAFGQRLRKLGSVDCGPQSTVGEVDVELLKGETIEPDAVRFFRSRPPNWHNPLAQKDGQPGVAFQWLEVEGPIYDSWPTPGEKLLFADLPVKEGYNGAITVTPNSPDADAERLVRGFVTRALRRPALPGDVQPYLNLFHTAKAAGSDFADAMITAYSAVLCSPSFVTLEERPGLLDDHALASRLSYFLWNSEPDGTLRTLADRGALTGGAANVAFGRASNSRPDRRAAQSIATTSESSAAETHTAHARAKAPPELAGCSLPRREAEASGRAGGRTPRPTAHRVSLARAKTPPGSGAGGRTAALTSAQARASVSTATLSAQADRMLADPRAERFIDAFLDYWLDLRKTDNTSPDEELYSDYYLDDYLVESSVDETRAFFRELARNDLPARNLVASDFVMINDRLATLYGIPGVEGSAIRRVALPRDSVRGGLLTQASVLKVTANGTTTSPVLRGVWINERILGFTVPPPPPSVPAVEPDIRGATTIREQLAKHRSQATCSACHAKIDPAGFALESFDVFGGYRECYRAIGPTTGPKVAGFGKNGQAFAFHDAQKVDPSGTLPDGRRFQGVRDLKRLLLQDERGIARNLVRQLVIYATGAPIHFADRPKIEAILDKAKPSGYGVKSIIHAIIESDLFRNK
ncbi:MAG TPA: DUF1588 domain-containing protein [Chthonomonadaceae bacterium]|nr:DUF1588 domain-containing protein [Chthonomonadaceae bacterium]